ncbi:MAG: mechanosensitive ion channel family protein, partial [Acidobacteria bacterium]|nr:mechanosensitive ion channel family protein [Acidobacteriota bacterium]
MSEAIASEAGAPAAKEGARTDKEATKVDAEALLDRIATASRELVVRMDTLRSGEGEQATDLLRDLARIGREQRADLEAVLDQIAQRKKMGSEVRGLVERSRQLLRRASRLRRGVIRKAEAETMEEAARRDSLAPDERFLFEHDLADRSALLDRTYEGLVAISEEMEEVGLDVSAERAFLERRLSERALLLLDEARGAREALMAPELQAAPGADVAVLETREFALEERADGSATSLLATIRLLDRLGIDTQDLAAKAAEVAAVVAPPASEAAAEAAESQARHWIAETRDFLRLRGPSLLLRLLVAIGVLVLSWLLARVARRITGWMVDRTRIASSRILRDTIVRVVGRVILVLGVIVALWQLGFAASPLLAGLGIV